MKTGQRTASALACVSIVFSLVLSVGAKREKPVYVQYEGFIKEPDGSMILSFGYFNTNDGEVAIPAGPLNRFTTPPDDRGQPTTFSQGRRRSACVMRLPAGFDGNLRWSVTYGGYQSVTTARVLDPMYALEEGSEKRALSALFSNLVQSAVCFSSPTPDS
jgi:hypothetical protein